MIRGLHVLAVAVVSLFTARTAIACPFCDSVTAEQVRAGIFDSDFLYHVFVSAAPFPILIGIVAYIYYGGMPTATATKADSVASFPDIGPNEHESKS